MAGFISSTKVMIFSQLVAFLFPMSWAVDSNCNYRQQMETDTTYYVYNREYPQNYGPSTNCRWVASVPDGYHISLTCDIQMPQSPGCSEDSLSVSLTGDPNFQDKHVYCGNGNMTVETNGTNIAIGLITSYNTPGGRFLCTMKAVQVAPPSCNCGWRNMRRIVGGVETGVNEYPMMAGIVDFQAREIACGGTIIGEQYVVTAAHCISKYTPIQIGVVVGEHNISSGTETDATRLFQSERFITHPNYEIKDGITYNDISIIKIIGYIIYNANVGPVCLPFMYYDDTFTGQEVTIMGWGTTEFTGPKSQVLLETDVTVVSPEQCYATVDGTIDQICTYREGHDACQSDSGGPVLLTRNNALELVGIVSQGFGCASNRPAVNTRVTSYLKWMLSVTPGASYCVR